MAWRAWLLRAARRCRISQSVRSPIRCLRYSGALLTGGARTGCCCARRAAYTAPKGLKQEDGSTIRKGTWIIDAHWYASTSESHERRSYKLLGDSLVHVPVQSLVQETDLHFERSSRHDSILGDECHLKIMRWNFSNVAQ